MILPIRESLFPEAFLAVDAILGIYTNIVSGLVVYPKMIEKHIMDELPFMMTENIMMEATKKGGNRQDLHEEIRCCFHGSRVRQSRSEGNPIIFLIFYLTIPSSDSPRGSLESLLDPKLYIGRCPEQVTTFIDEAIKPVLASHTDDLKVEDVELKV